MPELPEVEIIRRELEPALSGRKIERCTLNIEGLRYPFCADFTRIVEGKDITKIDRRGKYMRVFLGADHALVWHLGMSGRVKIFAPSAPYDPVKHDHVHWRLSGGGQIVYNDPRRFGFMQLVPVQMLEKSPPFSTMGPEPLGNSFNADMLRAALENRKTPIKIALLDQAVVAGIGNIYACEALYEAGIHPARLAGSLSEAENEALAHTIRSVLLKALDAGGSSLKDYRKTDGSLGYFQHMFSVYDREGEICPKCAAAGNGRKNAVKSGVGAQIQRMVQAGRSTFYCPSCQK